MKLYMLPYAGSGAMIYSKWKIDGIECKPIEYSGHGFRYQEPLFCDEKSVVADVIKQIDTNEPYAIFGHSMGGLIAWLLALELEKEQKSIEKRLPVVIFISACEPPDRLDAMKYGKYTDDKELISFLRKYNRLSEKRINTKEFCNIILPIILNDYRFLAGFNCQSIRKIEVPLVILYSKEDTLMRYDEMTGWNKYGDQVCFYELKGEHFYTDDNVSKIMSIIRHELYVGDRKAAT